MIQGYRALDELSPLHQDQHRLLFANCLGVIEKVATVAPTADTLPVGYMQFANIGGVKSLYFNLNGTIITADQAARDYVDDTAVVLTGNQTVAGVKTFNSPIVMQIENRTDDTGCTQTGRMWFRTDV